MSQCSLLIFTKAPELGRVKTRLAATVGETSALAVYQLLLNSVLDTAQVLQRQGWGAQLWVAGDPQHGAFIPYYQQGFVGYQQQGADLGARLLLGVEQALQGSESVLVVGGDCPSLQPGYLLQARYLLHQADVVIGPAWDGGYVLLGMRQPYAELFSEIDWGTEQVLQQTLERCEQQGLSIALLPGVSDIDEWPDVQAIGEQFGALGQQIKSFVHYDYAAAVVAPPHSVR